MSLVLEALKKLEREKERDERGFVVMTATPWPARAARLWPAWVAAGVAVGAAATFLVLRAARPDTAPSGPSSAAGAGVADVRPRSPVVAPPVTLAPRRTAAAARTAAVPAAGPSEQAAAPAATPDHGLRLQAVSERDGQPVAMISDRIVRVGDEFDGVRVVAIRLTEVDVEIGGQRSTLRF